VEEVPLRQLHRNKSDEKQTSVVLGVIFYIEFYCAIFISRNRALVAFKPTRFGLWCAIAIHDTSSVVGAA
jgi:uncharacterized membrane protein YadS